MIGKPGESINLPTAYLDPNRSLKDYRTLMNDIVPSSKINVGFERKSIKRKLEYGRLTEMSQPIQRISVREAPHLVDYLYNDKVNQVKED